MCDKVNQNTSSFWKNDLFLQSVTQCYSARKVLHLSLSVTLGKQIKFQENGEFPVGLLGTITCFIYLRAEAVLISEQHVFVCCFPSVVCVCVVFSVCVCVCCFPFWVCKHTCSCRFFACVVFTTLVPSVFWHSADLKFLPGSVAWL